MSRLMQLVAIVDRLRDPEGCPWDRAQTRRSMTPYLLEEVYEALDAADDPERLCEELGDLLFAVLLLSRILSDEGHGGIERVAGRIGDKMVRRHPHVFGGKDEEDAGSNAAWEARKSKTRKGGRLDGVPRSAPALLRAFRQAEKASGVGFDWPDWRGPRAKVDEELAELDEVVGDPEATRHELGDLLLAVANLGRHLGVPPEDALREANDRFAERFRGVEARAAQAGVPVEEAGPEQLDAWWEQAKAAQR